MNDETSGLILSTLENEVPQSAYLALSKDKRKADWRFDEKLSPGKYPETISSKFIHLFRGYGDIPQSSKVTLSLRHSWLVYKVKETTKYLDLSEIFFLQDFQIEIGQNLTYGFKLCLASFEGIFLFENSSDRKEWVEILAKFSLRNNFANYYKVVDTLEQTDKYKILKVMDRKTKKNYIAKSVQIDFLSGLEKQINPILRELKYLIKLEHPKIAKVLATFETSVSFIMVYDLDSEDTLSSYLRRNIISTEKINHIILKLVYLLKYLHSNNHCICNLSPDTLLYDEFSNDITLITVISIEKKKSKNKFIPYPGYFAPELLNEGLVSESADVFALGALLFKCLSGVGPFDGENFVATMNNNRNYIVNKPMAMNDSKVWSLVKMMMHESPLYRPSLDAILSHKMFTDLISVYQMKEVKSMDPQMIITCETESEEKISEFSKGNVLSKAVKSMEIKYVKEYFDFDEKEMDDKGRLESAINYLNSTSFTKSIRK